MTAHKVTRQTKLTPQRTHFILEKLTQWLNKLHIHPLWQTAHIVVRLDGHRRATRKGNGFDHIRIQSTLRKEISPANTLSLIFKDIDEQTTNDLTLALWIGLTFQCGDKDLRRIHMHQRDIVMLAEQGDDLLTFIQPHQTGINIDTG